MQENLSEILDNILGLLLLEGSYEIEEETDGFLVKIDTKDAGRLIGFKGESLDCLQLLVNQILTHKVSKETDFKRVVLDVAGWKKQKEEELVLKAKNWAQEVLESGQMMELEPMPAWQRRIIHMATQGVVGVVSESVGEGKDRHLVIKPGNKTENNASET